MKKLIYNYLFGFFDRFKKNLPIKKKQQQCNHDSKVIIVIEACVNCETIIEQCANCGKQLTSPKTECE